MGVLLCHSISQLFMDNVGFLPTLLVMSMLELASNELLAGVQFIWFS